MTELVADSFSLIDMVVELQENCGARLPQENLKDVRTLKDLLTQVETHILASS